MTPKEFMHYKADLERKASMGDESAAKELHDIIVEETGLLYQKPNGLKTPGERKHLRVMESLFNSRWNDTYTPEDWAYITSGNVKPMYTRSVEAA